MKGSRSWIITNNSKGNSELNFVASSNNNSSEERAFAEDAAGCFVWPPRCYYCTFCGREFRSAQALGGHMNVHRRDRARLHQTDPNHHGTDDQLYQSPSNDQPIISDDVPHQVCNYGPNYATKVPTPNFLTPLPKECRYEDSSVVSRIQLKQHKISFPSPSQRSWTDLDMSKVVGLETQKKQEVKYLANETRIQDCLDFDLEKGKSLNCKRKRNNKDTDLPFYMSPSPSIKCNIQSQIKTGGMEDIDLELRLGSYGAKKVKSI
ncbi:hypothetical protein ACFE04_014458 [Oxalis oulophora]